MNHITKSIFRFVLALLFTVSFSSFGITAEIDDTAVFIDAFNAYQQKDYLLVIEKCEQLNQVFPDSPLRDVTLLLVARASLRSGDNERAAKAAVLFSSEFPDSSLKTTVEEELNVLASRHQKGEVLAGDKSLQRAARKVSADRLAREHAAELKREEERAAKAKAEQERLARIKREEERREEERLMAERLAKASISASIAFSEAVAPVPAGGNGTLPFTISNTGKNSEEFLLSVTTAKEYDATISSAGKPVASGTRLLLAPDETIKGTVIFRMPAEMVDGHRAAVLIKAVSAKFSDVVFQREGRIISSAPLVRAIAKLNKAPALPDEKLRYRVTVINAGSLPARDLTVRIQLPSYLDLQGTPDVTFEREPDGTIIFKVDRIDSGKFEEINLNVKIRDNSTVDPKLPGNVTIINNLLQKKDSFPTSTSMVRAK